MEEFKQFRRKGLSEMRPYVQGEDLSNVSVSKTDIPEQDMGMIARNPKDHNDQWYVARKYFEDNLEEVPSAASQAKRLPFGVALSAAKYGRLISREGWNGKGQYVFMRPADQLTANFVIGTVKSLPADLKSHIHETHKDKDGNEFKINFTPYLCLLNAQGDVVNGWVPSQGDLFAEDWEIKLP